jgi:hypothetical protein
VVFAATRLSSLGSLLGVWSFALLFALREQSPRPLIALALGGAVLVTLRHRENIAASFAAKRNAPSRARVGVSGRAGRSRARRPPAARALSRCARGVGDGVFSSGRRDVDSIGTVR